MSNKYDQLNKGKWLSKEKSSHNRVKFWGNPRKKMLCEKLDNSLATLMREEAKLDCLEPGEDANEGMIRRTIKAVWRQVNNYLDIWNN